MNPIQIVLEASNAFNPGGIVSINPLTLKIYSGIYSLHKFWRYIRFINTTFDSNNFLSLVGGYGLDFMSKDGGMVSSIMRAAAYWIMVTQRVVVFIKQKPIVARAVADFSDAFYGRYVVSKRCVWEKDPDGTICSPSTVNWCYDTWDRLSLRVYLVVMCTVKLLKEIFTLSMRFLDIMELLTLNKDLIREGVCHIGVHLKDIAENKNTLREGIRLGKPIISIFMKMLHAKTSVDDFEKVLERSVDMANGSMLVSKICGTLQEKALSFFGNLTDSGISSTTLKKPPPEKPLKPVLIRCIPWPNSQTITNANIVVDAGARTT